MKELLEDFTQEDLVRFVVLMRDLQKSQEARKRGELGINEFISTPKEEVDSFIESLGIK